MKPFIISLLALCFCIESHAFGRTHAYSITVVDKVNNAMPNITVKTSRVQGYDQNNAECTTSSEGKCSLSFGAFAPTNTRVDVSLASKDDLSVQSDDHTLPVIKNSVFSNNDSAEVTLVFDLEAIKEKRNREARLRAAAKDERDNEIKRLVTAARDAVVLCNTKESCDRAFELTEVFFATSADTKIQTATNTTLETYKSTGLGKISLKALKIPQGRNSYRISLTVNCDDGGMVEGIDLCIKKRILTYVAFKEFMTREFQE